jgi:hypothetical protein
VAVTVSIWNLVIEHNLLCVISYNTRYRGCRSLRALLALLAIHVVYDTSVSRKSQAHLRIRETRKGSGPRVGRDGQGTAKGHNPPPTPVCPYLLPIRVPKFDHYLQRAGEQSLIRKAWE